MATAQYGPPELVHPHVQRPRLGALLDEAASRRVCLVVGAAGWGKTTALAAWSLGRRVAWFRIAQLAEHGEDDALSALSEVADLPGDEELALVFDDAHELHHHPALADFVEKLCHRGSDRLRILLATRSEPPFSLARLRGRGEVGEVNATHLAFDTADVARLTTAALGDADPDLTRAVHDATDGWPAAVRLAVEGLTGIPPCRRVTQLDAVNGPGGRLATYPVEEVLGRR